MKIIIQTKNQIEDRINVTVAVVDGETELFGRAFQGRDWKSIESQIDQLEKNLSAVAVELDKVPLGEFVPPIKEEKELTPLELATQRLYELKEKISLGVMKESDQEFMDAVEAYKALISK